MFGSLVTGAIIFASGKTSAKVCGNVLDKHAHTDRNNETRTRLQTINRMDAESRSHSPLSRSLTTSFVEECALCKWLLAD